MTSETKADGWLDEAQAQQHARQAALDVPALINRLEFAGGDLHREAATQLRTARDQIAHLQIDLRITAENVRGAREEIARLTQQTQVLMDKRIAADEARDLALRELAQAQRRNEQHTAAYGEVASHAAELERQLAQADSALAYRLGLATEMGYGYVEHYSCEAAERHRARSAGEPGADSNRQTEGESS